MFLIVSQADHKVTISSVHSTFTELMDYFMTLVVVFLVGEGGEGLTTSYCKICHVGQQYNKSNNSAVA